jgi:hypothetical protein
MSSPEGDDNNNVINVITTKDVIIPSPCTKKEISLASDSLFK